MVALGKLPHRRAFLERVEDEVQTGIRIFVYNPVLLVGIALHIGTRDHGRASTLGAGRVAIKYLFGAQYVVMAFLVAKAFVGDASKIFKAYRDEIERHFDTSVSTSWLKKNSTDHSHVPVVKQSNSNSGYTARPSTKLLPRKLSPGLPP